MLSQDFFKQFFDIFEQNGFNIIHIVAPHDRVGRRVNQTFEELRFSGATFYIANLKYRNKNGDNGFDVRLNRESDNSISLVIFTEAKGIKPEWLEVSGFSFEELLQNVRENLFKKLPFSKSKILPTRKHATEKGQSVEILDFNKRGVVRGLLYRCFLDESVIYDNIHELYKAQGHFAPYKVLIENDTCKDASEYGYPLEFVVCV